MNSLQTRLAKVRLGPVVPELLDAQPIAERLLKLSMDTGCDVIQSNGQRLFGPDPNWSKKIPPHGSEVFVGKLPRDCMEDELYPIFKIYGDIYCLRLMMNFSGLNRGFAFVTYENPEVAWNAVTMLNNLEIRPGHRIGVTKSVDNCRLYIGGIDPEVNEADVWKEVQALLEAGKQQQQIAAVILYPDTVDPRRNRGFAFVEFENHRDAAMVKRTLSSAKTRLFNREVVVDWADPEPDLDPEIYNNLTKLFVRNLGPCPSADKFRFFLRTIVPDDSITRVYCSSHYAFLHFTTRQYALLAKEALERTVFSGYQLEVHWARPKEWCKPIVAPNCRSVPPRLRRANSLNTSPVNSDQSSGYFSGSSIEEVPEPINTLCGQQFPPLGSSNTLATYTPPAAAKPQGYPSMYPPAVPPSVSYSQNIPQNGLFYSGQIFDFNKNYSSVPYGTPFVPEGNLYIPPPLY